MGGQVRAISLEKATGDDEKPPGGTLLDRADIQSRNHSEKFALLESIESPIGSDPQRSVASKVKVVHYYLLTRVE
jgi:hypothetical protein